MLVWQLAVFSVPNAPSDPSALSDPDALPLAAEFWGQLPTKDARMQMTDDCKQLRELGAAQNLQFQGLLGAPF